MNIKILIIFILLFIIFLLIYNLYFNLDETYSRKVFNFGELINNDIQLRYIPNFLTSEECDHLINISKDKLDRSRVITDKVDSYDNDRTSYSYYLKKQHDDIVKKIEEKASQYTDKSINTIEALQVVRYQDGQEFKAHYDWFHPPYRNKIQNQRQYTFFIYLNDVENEGETHFPNINQTFKPKKGHALFWENCSSLDVCFDKALHQGKPPKGGIKYGLNIWINFKPLT